MTGSSLAPRVLAGESRAVARAISVVENSPEAGAALVHELFNHTGRAFVVGMTGPPGAGKSTLVDRLAAEIRARNQKVGIVAVDPTSPFTGGAILGDRLRMQSHAKDPGVFIRSMATRGHLGGLSRATGDAVVILDAAGTDIIIIETVGVGQDEVEIIRHADVSVVTLVPGTGDEVQALKAGIMEIADVFVVNKKDREGADRLAAAVEAMLSLRAWAEGEWRPPIVSTQATTGEGVTALFDAILTFQARAGDLAHGRRRARAEFRLRDLLTFGYLEHVTDNLLEPGELEGMIDKIAAREIDPYSAAAQILKRTLK